MINDLQNYYARFCATDLSTSPIVKKIKFDPENVYVLSCDLTLSLISNGQFTFCQCTRPPMQFLHRKIQ